MEIVVVSGGFDPLHKGHISYLHEAANLGTILMVGLNSDAWLTRKKGKPFMDMENRLAIMSAMSIVDTVYEYNDDDDSSVDLLEKIKEDFPEHEIIFANGGDRTVDNIPEMRVAGVKFVFGVGGTEKQNSSSWILENWNLQHKRTDTRWGHYSIIRGGVTNVIKELVVKPGGCLSYQRHEHRDEFWVVTDGIGKVIFNDTKGGIDHTYDSIIPLEKGSNLHIKKTVWHQLINDSKTESLRLIEIQCGRKCLEGDIESE